MHSLEEITESLTNDRDTIVDNLTTMGIEDLTGDETFTELAPRILEIASGGQQIQYDVMPTPGADDVGKIIQYTGTTDANYTNGYFYAGTSDGASTPTYSWENIYVDDNTINKMPLFNWQPSAVLDGSDYTLSSADRNNLTGIIQSIFNGGRADFAIYCALKNDTGTGAYYKPHRFLLLQRHSKAIYAKPTILQFSAVGLFDQNVSSAALAIIDLVLTLSWSGDTVTVTAGTLYNQRKAYAEASSLANYLSKTNTEAYTPTADYHPATKKYVDDNAGGGSSSNIIHYVPSTIGTQANPFIFADYEPGIYITDVKSLNSYFYIKAKSTDATARGYMLQKGMILIDYKSDINNYTSGTLWFADIYTGLPSYSDRKLFTPKYDSNGLDTSSSSSEVFMIANELMSVNKKHTYYVLPESSVTPTSNNQFTNKAYVDNAIASAITTTLGGSY